MEKRPLRNKLIASATLALSALTMAAAPIVAQAQPHRHRVLVCSNPHRAGNTGTVVGAITGGLIGNAVSHGGGRTGGTIIGAGVGAVAGHQIAKQHAKHNCHYEWR